MLEGEFTTIADSFSNFERHVLTGEVSDVRREYAKSVFYSGALMTMNLVSTILNGQRLTDDATTNMQEVEQPCGRVTREFPGKLDFYPVVMDFVDPMPMLHRMFEKRRSASWKTQLPTQVRPTRRRLTKQ